jgi:hypothetical protein
MGVIYIDGIPEAFTGNLLDYNRRNIHRDGGPAISWDDGRQDWYINGKPHRVDGPAITLATGAQQWYQNGKLHREDGPAIIWDDGNVSWYINDRLHREDGPAIEWVGGVLRTWALNGKKYSFEEFLKQLPEEDAVMVKLTWG